MQRITIIEPWTDDHFHQYLKRIVCSILFSLFHVGIVHAAPVSASFQQQILPATTSQNEEQSYVLGAELTMNPQPTFTRAQYQSMLSSTHPEKITVTMRYPEDMICSKDSTRADQNLNLHEEIAQTERGPIGYYRFGHGRPLVLITGHLSTLSEWNTYFLSELAKKYEVVIFDNRGIGRSSTDTSSYRVEDLSLDTATLIQTLGFNSVSVLGWSMGGMIAQRLVLDRPGLIDNLILLNSAPPGRTSSPVSNQVEEALSGHSSSHFEGVMKVLFPADAVQLAESCFIGDMFKPHDYVTTRISAKVSTAQQRLVLNWSLDDHTFAALHHVRTPTLVLAGTDDEVLGLRNSVILKDAIPHAKLVQVQAAGHAMMYQYPKELAHLIETFIGEKR